MEDSTQFQDLIDKYLDENLQPREKEELERRLLQCESARQEFWKLTEVHGLLRESLTTKTSPQESAPEIIEFDRAKRLWRRTLAAACITSGLLLLATWKLFFGQAQTPGTTTAPHQYLARIGYQSNEVLKTGQFQPKEFIKTGYIEFEEGLMELRFFNDVKVLLQGPVGVHLKTLDHMVLHHGRFTADVPEGAQGFTVSTPLGEVIDLGTQFGVSMDADGQVEAHVFKGEVDVDMPGRVHNLHSTEALRLAPESARTIPAAPARFPSMRTTLEIPLQHGGFEPGTLVEIGDRPTGLGLWSGDRARTVGPDQNIHPHAGTGMLRFEHTYNDSALFSPESNYYMSTQQQIIDISALRKAHPGARLSAEATAFFNRIDAGADTDSQFIISIRACVGSIENLQFENLNLDTSRQASIEHSLLTDDDPATWEPLSTKINIPKNANLLVLRVGAYENERNDPHESQELDGHYVDSVSLHIHRSPVPGRRTDVE